MAIWDFWAEDVGICFYGIEVRGATLQALPIAFSNYHATRTPNKVISRAA